MYRASSLICAIVACGLLAYAGYSAYHEPTEVAALTETEAGPADVGDGYLVVENAEQNLGERQVGEHRVVFRVSNLSERPGEVVGGSSGCTAICCFQIQDLGRVPVPPGGFVE